VDLDICVCGFAQWASNLQIQRSRATSSFAVPVQFRRSYLTSAVTTLEISDRLLAASRVLTANQYFPV